MRMLGRLAAAMALVIAIGLGVAFWHYSRDIPERFADDPVAQFKYGSTGGDRIAGVPWPLFQALPILCADYFPGEGWQSFGFLFEPGNDRPIGTSKRYTLGIERVSLNCAACHVGTWREDATSGPNIVVGMPANGLDLGGFARMLGACAADERFNPWQAQNAMDAAGVEVSWWDRAVLSWIAVPAMKEALILARHRFRFLDMEPAPGPGRFDTFNPAKMLLNWPIDDLDPATMIGTVDFPSLWLQGPRDGMQLHWDGNNTSVEERNRSASFGSGAVPTTLDRESLEQVAAWLRDGAVPPPWPFPIDEAKAARGGELYGVYCAECHGRSGRDFAGAKVGTVEPIAEIGTDPCRLDNYTYELAVEQGNFYAAFPDERFRAFRKTHGYANMPLDGLWLRGPYLHNGSVPTVRDLLEPAASRPAVFWRGNDVIDRERLGFVADVPGAHGRDYFRYETRCIDDADAGIVCDAAVNPENRHDEHRCVPGPWAGNSNRGHEGLAYGTYLPPSDKDALVEYLKTF